MSKNFAKLTDDVLRCYDEVITDLSNLITKLELSSDVLTIYKTFMYMYENGYLSLNKKFNIPSLEQFSHLEDHWYYDLSGAMLMFLKGVCRHYADYLNYLYSKLGFSCAEILVYLPSITVNILGVENNREHYWEAQEIVDEFYKLIRENLEKCLHLEAKLDSDKTVVCDYYQSHAKKNHAVNVIKEKDINRIHIISGSQKFHYEKEGNILYFYIDGLRCQAIIMPDFGYSATKVRKFNEENSRELLLNKTNLVDDFDILLKPIKFSEYDFYFEEFKRYNNKKYREIYEIHKSLEKIAKKSIK